MRERCCLMMGGIILICILAGCASARKESSHTEADETVISTECDIVNSEEINPSTQVEHTIFINEIDDDAEIIFVGSMFDLDEENFKEMSREEILDYFDVELEIDSVLPNMVEDVEERYGFYQFADGSVFDQHAFSFQNNEETLHIVMRGDKLPIHSIGESNVYDFEKSQIYGYETLLVHFVNSAGKDIYYAEFIKNKVGMTINYEGKNEADFIKIVEYLLCQ